MSYIVLLLLLVLLLMLPITVLVLVPVLVLPLLLLEFLLSLLPDRNVDFTVLFSFSGLRLRLIFVCILCIVPEINVFPVYEAMRISKFGTQSFNI